VAAPSSTSVVIPAYNEQASVGAVIEALAAAADWHEILVIDDGSDDGTAAAAHAAGAHVIQHPYNKGNGAAVKTGIRQATGEFIVILDADGQHKAALAPRLVARLGEYDLVVGARSPRSQATVGRRLGNRLLAQLAGALAGHPIPDLTSGFRAARRVCLREFLHLLPNGFSTPTTTTLAFFRAGYSVAFEPAEADARTGRSKIRFTRDGVKFLLILLRVITIFSPLRIFAPMSVAALTLGIGYASWTLITVTKVTNFSVLLIVLGVVVFLLGLVSEQISTMRFEHRNVEPMPSYKAPNAHTPVRDPASVDRNRE
jgi:glycosyltransferase involved in cell wall biosynthesis